jgi:hypothetical protein
MEGQPPPAVRRKPTLVLRIALRVGAYDFFSLTLLCAISDRERSEGKRGGLSLAGPAAGGWPSTVIAIFHRLEP